MMKNICTKFVRVLFGIFLAGSALSACAADAQLTPVRIAPGIYVVYGDPNPPSYDNDALTVNIGIVVTSAGVAIIDSGPSYRVAQMLDQAVQKITSNSIKYVINTGPEPARWLGNSYFKKLGIPIVAHEEARKLMQARGAAQLQAMKTLLKGKAAGTELALPRGFSDDSEEIRFSDSTLQLSYFGASQSPGTIGVWLPRQQIAFAGAIMQSQLLPALTADSALTSWIEAFDGVAALGPTQLVPGRGAVGDLARMRADTRDYLVALRDEVAQAKRGGGAAEQAAEIAKSKKLLEFKRLQGYSSVASSNIALALQQSDAGR